MSDPNSLDEHFGENIEIEGEDEEDEGEREFEDEDGTLEDHDDEIDPDNLNDEGFENARAQLRSPDGESKIVAVNEDAEVEEEPHQEEIMMEDTMTSELSETPSLDSKMSTPAFNEKGRTTPPEVVSTKVKEKKRKRRKKEKSEAEKLKEKKALQHFLFDRMSRRNELENLNSQLNARLLRKKWLKVLRTEKVSQLKKEIEILSVLHDRHVDRKDQMLSVLWSELTDSEKQFQKTVRMHKNHVNELIELQKLKITKFEKMSRKYLSKLESEYSDEFREMESMHKTRVGELRDVSREMIRRENSREYELDKEFEIQKKAIKNKYTRLFHVMGIQMKKLIRIKEKVMEEESRDIGRPIQKKYADYIAKRDENQELSDKIKYQKTIIKRYEDNLSVWKAKWLNNLREFQRRNTNLNTEIKKLRKHFHSSKRKMVAQRDDQKKKLTSLVKASGTTSSVLDARIAQARVLLEIFHLNKKHESEMERNIQNFVEKMEDPDIAEMDSFKQAEYQDEKTQLDYIILQNSRKLGRYFSKYNKVSLETNAEKEKQKELLKENKILKMMLKKYLDGIAVNEEILRQENNTLLMVKPITQQVVSLNEKVPN